MCGGALSKGFRTIIGLISAAPCPRPSCIPKSRPRGKKAAGLKYEKELARGIVGAKHGQWFAFVDRKGSGYCQPDILLETPFGIAILESKYTWTDVGHRQIAQLYKPVVEAVYRKRTFGIVVCKVLTPAVNQYWVCRDLKSAIGRACSGEPTILHWIGAGLGPLQLSAA